MTELNYHLKEKIIGATIKKDENGVWVVNISGELSKSDVDAIQQAGIKGAVPGERARVLVVLDKNFSGFRARSRTGAT